MEQPAFEHDDNDMPETDDDHDRAGDDDINDRAFLDYLNARVHNDADKSDDLAKFINDVNAILDHYYAADDDCIDCGIHDEHERPDHDCRGEPDPPGEPE